MGINFPASPTVGQKYPQPAVAGIPVYTWDGEKWTTVGGSIAAYAPPADAIPLMDATPGLVGTTTEYAREDHVHPTDTTRAGVNQAVRYDAAQTLTAPQLVQARTNIYAAPFDAMAYSGMQINGNFSVNQEGTVSANGNNVYYCDGWKVIGAGTMNAGSGLVNATVPGLHGMSQTTVAIAQTSMGASDFYGIRQTIEGFRISRLAWGTANAQPITISFWSSHHRTGIYSVAVINGANDRSYVAAYTQAAADTPQFNVITVPGDTSGVWSNLSNAGLHLNFTLACGTTYTASSANTWLAGNYIIAAPGQVNGVAATSDVFNIQGVTLLPGTQAPTAAQSPNIMRPYDQELVTCMRYYEKLTASVAQGINVNGGHAAWIFKASKRVIPTFTYSGDSYYSFVFSISQDLFSAYSLSGTSALTIGAGSTVDARL